MESKKFYVVSFSDSRQYTLATEGHDGLDRLTKIENELNTYLRGLFPDQTFAYYTTPKVTEISAEHASRYASYPPLDDKAIAAIKEELKREITMRQDLRELNNNAPENDVAPKY